ncbi:Cyclic di-GMP phosphodiesterase Gmr [Planctomycetes bacterium CA13]|uniref:Cyclic di-GMP phosphodiesterase Gmr n=1 Tax=Novipirellula herctigrandis TaxID=2527986 RepID=A0A5C5YN20_9BACT|nr:Cyclic di-GMP phosphodiesterase Gmr [Planctomycetes bacterium CA13]
MRVLNTTEPCKILLVDDQSSVHDAYRAILSSSTQNAEFDTLEAALFGERSDCHRGNLSSAINNQFELCHAMQGEHAIELAHEAIGYGDPFEMAFVDLRMPPGIDGIETITKLWEIDPLLQVVLCPAFSEYSWSSVVKQLGYVDNLLLLKKPFANEEVFQLAMAMTHKRRALSDSRRQLERLRETNEQLEREIGSRKLAETELQYAATHDHLTKLPNRNFLKRVLTERFASAVDSACCDALIFLDLDNFKVINDSLGHAIGDELLIQVAERLQAVVDKVNREATAASPCLLEDEPCLLDDELMLSMVARLGGDEFVVFLIGNDNEDSIIELAEEIRSLLCHPYQVLEHELTLGTSLGIAFCSETATTPEELMRNADLAMYRAKFSGKQRLAVFDHAMHEKMSKRLELEEALRTVIKDGGLRLVYQPIFDMYSGAVNGLESLVRWDHATKGLISPVDFVPVAEETGLIVAIGRWILEEACRTICRLNLHGEIENTIPISVNVSKRQIIEHDFVDLLEDVLQEYQVPARLLNLEITESLIMESPEQIVERLNRISRLGVQIHMDDFGTGHSSLSCLHRFPIDVLKIDRSFVSTMKPGDDYESIIHAIITLAHNLDTKVIAEGIETPQQLQQLRDLECDFGQGYLYCKPKSIEGLTDLLLGVGPVPATTPEYGFSQCRSLVASNCGGESI